MAAIVKSKHDGIEAQWHSILDFHGLRQMVTCAETLPNRELVVLPICTKSRWFSKLVVNIVPDGGFRTVTFNAYGMPRTVMTLAAAYEQLFSTEVVVVFRGDWPSELY